ncbi:hypothetical protein HD554DRAFT_2040854 [Boletus coccyginus]|nr:hypothetical protein HD554DRAFT_2040854 [Boletus coccyginus]
MSTSLSSNSSTRRPLGPRQPSPRITSVSGIMKDLSVPSGQVGTTERKHAISRLMQPQTPEVNHIRTRAPAHLLTPRSVSQTPMRTVSCQTSQQSSMKQLLGRPPRACGRTGAHGVRLPARCGGEKEDQGKENTKGCTTALKENKENEGVPIQTTMGSNSDDDVESRVEAEVAAEVEKLKEVAANAEGERPTTTQTVRNDGTTHTSVRIACPLLPSLFLTVSLALTVSVSLPP